MKGPGLRRSLGLINETCLPQGRPLVFSLSTPDKSRIGYQEAEAATAPEIKIFCLVCRPEGCDDQQLRSSWIMLWVSR